MKKNNDSPKTQKWVWQTVICLIIFCIFYMAKGTTGTIAERINNFRIYAITHNTDFKWIFNNTVQTVSKAVDMMFIENDETENVFNSTGGEETAAEPVSEIIPESDKNN